MHSVVHVPNQTEVIGSLNVALKMGTLSMLQVLIVQASRVSIDYFVPISFLNVVPFVHKHSHRLNHLNCYLLYAYCINYNE